MNIFFNEKALLNYIKYGAIIIVVISSFIITNIFIEQKKEYLEKELEEIEKSFIRSNKIVTENLVNNIHNFIKVEKEIEEKELKKKIKEQVTQAYSVIEGIYNQSIKDPSYSKEKTIQLIKESVREMRFNNNLGYIFIYGLDGKNILNSQFPEVEGKNLWNFKDSKGTLLLQEMKKLFSKNSEVYYSWFWKRPDRNDGKEYQKLGFFKTFEPYNIFIGSGDYIKDFEKKLQEKVLNKLNSLEFKKPQHIFIYDENGLCLVNPKKELIGVNRYNSKNKYGKYVLKEILDFTLKNKEGFVQYKGSVIMNKENKTNDKISFLKLFDSWNWMIGSGFYLEELYEKIEEKKSSLEKSNEIIINKIVIFSFIITLIMAILSFYLSSLFSTIFITYKSKITKEMKNSLEKENLLIQQSKMATMGEMIGNIAHQWKQPLSIISMSNGLIKINQEDNTFSTEKELDDAVRNIDTSVKYLSTTIDDFRNFFSPDKQKKYFGLKETFDKACNLLNSQFKNYDIDIIKNIDNIELYGYQNELLQVLINILKNAKDEFIKNNNKDKKIIVINAFEEDNNIIIKIKDNAGGIPSEIIDKIFDAYFSTKDKSATGIGLYMSNQITQSMNGKLLVSNVEYIYENISYKGAEFTIYLKRK